MLTNKLLLLYELLKKNIVINYYNNIRFRSKWKQFSLFLKFYLKN